MQWLRMPDPPDQLAPSTPACARHLGTLPAAVAAPGAEAPDGSHQGECVELGAERPGSAMGSLPVGNTRPARAVITRQSSVEALSKATGVAYRVETCSEQQRGEAYRGTWLRLLPRVDACRWWLALSTGVPDVRVPCLETRCGWAEKHAERNRVELVDFGPFDVVDGAAFFGAKQAEGGLEVRVVPAVPDQERFARAWCGGLRVDGRDGEVHGSSGARRDHRVVRRWRGGALRGCLGLASVRCG